jgi:hypothetical protein
LEEFFMRVVLKLLAAVAATLVGASPAAALTYTTDFSSGIGAEWSVVAPDYDQQAGVLGAMSNDGTNGSATLTVSGGAPSPPNSGTLTFDLIGYTSIDGAGPQSCCQDLFSLTINNIVVFQQYFGMQWFADVAVTNTTGTTYTSAPGMRTITTPFTPIVGVNTFVFSYGPLQGIADEAWALDNVSVSGPSAAPEPGTWAMMLLGVAALGLALRRRPSPAAA